MRPKSYLFNAFLAQDTSVSPHWRLRVQLE
jgi:hypothetical protein